MLGQRRRRWASIDPTLCQRLVVAGAARVCWGKPPFHPPSLRAVSSPLTRKYSTLCGTSVTSVVAILASDRQGSNFESCVRRAALSHSSHLDQKLGRH